MRIGELARITAHSVKALRYYHEIGILVPIGRTPSGYRVYGDDAIERLRFVKDARSLGFRLSEIGEVLSATDGGSPGCRHMLDIVDANARRIDEQIERLTALRSQLTSVRRKVTRRIATDAAAGGQGCPCVSDPA